MDHKFENVSIIEKVDGSTSSGNELDVLYYN